MGHVKNDYIIPVRKEDLLLTVSDFRVHSDFLKYAIDFIVCEGTEILAARGGKVSGVHVESNEGGTEEKYQKDPWGFVNWITIDHENGEFSQYFHLRHKGSHVKLGQRVNVGDVIGYSGNTGFSSGPHLHFQVCVENDSEVGWETLEVDFGELRIIRKPEDLTEKDKDILLSVKE